MGIPLTTSKKQVLKKDLEYAIIVSFIDFNPEKFGPKTVIVDGRVAIKLNGRVYTEI